METTLKKQSNLMPSEKTRGIIVDIICYLFVILFVYTASSKLMDFKSFKAVLGVSPLIKDYNIIVAGTIPTVEILISLFLIIPYTKKIGLYASLILMCIFTIYLIYMIFSGSTLPCHCGGVIGSMSWKQHIWFNFAFIIAAIVGLRFYK